MGKSRGKSSHNFNDGDRFEKVNDSKNFRRLSKDSLRNLKNIDLEDFDQDDELDLPELDIEINVDTIISKKESKYDPNNTIVDIRANKLIKDPDEIKRLLA